MELDRPKQILQNQMEEGPRRNMVESKSKQTKYLIMIGRSS